MPVDSVGNSERVFQSMGEMWIDKYYYPSFSTSYQYPQEIVLLSCILLKKKNTNDRTIA